MYFTDDSRFPENMLPTLITATPFGPARQAQACTFGVPIPARQRASGN